MKLVAEVQLDEDDDPETIKKVIKLVLKTHGLHPIFRTSD